MMTPDEIEAFIASAFGRNIQDEIEGIVSLNDDGSNPAENFQYTIPVQIKDQPEVLYARYDPLADATAFADGSPVLLRYNADGELEVRFDARRGRQAYGGVIPTRNMLFQQHNHEDAAGGGQLNAGLIFDDGQVLLEYGGTESDLSGLTTGALVVKGASGLEAWNLTANNVVLGNGTGAPLLVAPGTSGNVLTSNGTTFVSQAPAVPAAAAGWTDDGTVVRLTTSTDSVSIGTATANGKLYVLGDDDMETTLRVVAAAAQSAGVVIIQNNAGDLLFSITPAGQVSVNPGEVAGGDFIASGMGVTLLFTDSSTNTVFIDGTFVFNQLGSNIDARFAGDNDANLLFLVASTDRVGIGDSTPDGRFAVVGRADEVQAIFRGNATQTSNIFEIQDSASNVQVSVSGLGAAVFNEEGNDADFRIESDTQANAFFLDGANGAIQQLGNAPAAYLHMAASTTSLASYRVPAGTAPSSPGEGDGYNSSTIKSMGLFVAGVWQYVPGRIFTATANAGPSNTTAETSIVGSGIGTITLPANFFTAGKVYEFDVDGMYSTDGTSRDIQVRIKLGSTTIGDATLISTANSVNGGRTFRIRYRIRCVTTGASGTMQGQGMMWGQNVQQGFNTDGTVTVDTTGTLAAAATADFVTSNANCHFTSNILTVRAIN